MMAADLYYQKHVFVCNNERPAGHARGCCKEKGGPDLRNYLKARVKELNIRGVRVNNAGCLDRCELGAVMVIYPEGVWYHCASRQDIEDIIAQHLQAGKIVRHLQLQHDQIALTESQKENLLSAVQQAQGADC